MQWIKGSLALLVPAAALAALPLITSCTEVECGQGTFEEDGECRVDDGFDPDDPRCGAGTELVDGECVPIIDPAICDDDTTVPEVQPDGTILCVGVGGGGCGTISCGDPGGGGFVSLCGQLYDIETNEMIRAPDASGTPCDPADEATEGPCSLEVKFYDALGFAANPTGTAEQDFESKEINDCGHFKGIKVERPFSGQIAIGIDDRTGGGNPPDNYLLAGVANTFDTGERRSDLRAFAYLKTTNEAWTTSAGNPFAGGASFHEKGSYVPVFCQPDCETGAPVENVKILRGVATSPDDDYYFDDTDPNMRTTIGTGDATGPNGTGIMVNSSLGEHSGEGGDIGSCEWQAELAASVPSALFFRESFTHEPDDEETLCSP